MAGSSLGAEAAGNLVFQFRPTDRPFCCIVGKGDQPISGETEDVVLEVPKTFKETAEFSFANPAALPGNFFRLRMDGHSFFDKLVILLKISVQFLGRESVCAFRCKHCPAVAHCLQQFPQLSRPVLISRFLRVNQFPLQMSAAHGVKHIIRSEDNKKIDKHPEMIKWDYYQTRFRFGKSPVYKFEVIVGYRGNGEIEIYDVYPAQTGKSTVNGAPTTDVVRNSPSVDSASENNIPQGEETVKSRLSLRVNPQNADTSEETRQLQHKAVEIFGKTYNWNVTGYVLPDGTRLDFSGKREGSPGKYREEEHRNIREAYGEDTEMSGTEAMIDFMRRGAIRIMPESGGIQLQTIPIKAQLLALDGFISKMRGEVVIDIDDQDGNTVFSKEYDHGTFSRSIIAEIPELFEQAGKSNSDTARFHSMYSQREDGEDRQADADINDLQEDADFYAQAMTDEETAQAVRLFAKIYRSLESAGNDLVGKTTEREDWKTRLSGMGLLCGSDRSPFYKWR